LERKAGKPCCHTQTARGLADIRIYGRNRCHVKCYPVLRTATVADPKADPHATGKTNLQHYLDQTGPTLPPLTERKAVE